MEIVYPGNPNFDQDRQISNARFDLTPAAIYYCETDADVQRALRDAGTGPFRVRSGGHQHEGMCSGNGVLLIDVSRMDRIQASPAEETAWVGPGAKLRNLYGALFGYKRLIPGGGCGDVCIGGLVQGGGWGPYSRKLGLTCDRLIGFKMVMADGTVRTVAVGDKDYDELFWAVRGAGGGNFGIITDLQFSLAKNEGQIWSFVASLDEWDNVQKVTERWMKYFPGDSDWNLTTFCRLSAEATDPHDPPLVISGNYLGTQAALEQVLRRLFDTWYEPLNVKYSPVNAIGKLFNPEYQPGPSLTDTCAGYPLRHKVSSCFPSWKFGPAAMAAIIEYLKASPPQAYARRYLSLHSMGGFINSADNLYGSASRSCFPYRAKPFMLQYQAWWQFIPNDPNRDDHFLEWVGGFRDRMKGDDYTEGAFINFPDKDMAGDRGRDALLTNYYAGNYANLRQVKRQYDPGNRFKFEMSIPLP